MVEKKTAAIIVLCITTILCIGLWSSSMQEANRLEGQLWELEGDYEKLARVRTSLEENYSELRTEKEDLEKDYSDLEVEYSSLEIEYFSLKEDYDVLLQDVEDLTITINLKIDYGGGNVTWHNATRVPLDANLLTATRLIASVDYTTSDFGAFVNEIDGVGGDADTYWLWHYLDKDTGNWEYGPSGADLWVLHNGDTVSWIYTTF